MKTHSTRETTLHLRMKSPPSSGSVFKKESTPSGSKNKNKIGAVEEVTCRLLSLISTPRNHPEQQKPTNSLMQERGCTPLVWLLLPHVSQLRALDCALKWQIIQSHLFFLNGRLSLFQSLCLRFAIIDYTAFRSSASIE